MSTGSRPLRADAARNRAKVLAAAEEVFTTQGPTASTEDVARLAGVGIATVFRHFPTKEALLAAVVTTRMRRLADQAAALAADPDAEPGDAFVAFFTGAVAQSAVKSAMADAVAAGGVDIAAAVAEVTVSVRETMHKLLTRAQAVGAVRDDIDVDDVIALLAGASRAAEQAGERQRSRERTLAVVLDGLRGNAR